MTPAERITEINRLLAIFNKGCGNTAVPPTPATDCEECTADILRRIQNVAAGRPHDEDAPPENAAGAPDPAVIRWPVSLEDGRTLNPGDLLVIDRETGRARLAIAGEPGQRFSLPAQFTITDDGLLEIPVSL